MKFWNWLGSSIALAGAAWVLLPSSGHAWVVLGSGLGPDQRDFRIYNNFSAPQANDNVTPDADFPGALGAVMAIWKGCVEWGSRVHGDGNGDPSQPGGLGSGAANFDAVYAGQANGVGTTNDNILSQLSGSGGAILAFTELPTEDGWRIRFYGVWTWSDGPGSVLAPAEVDLQGVATHEYGHALGLGHTTVASSTMVASIISNGVPMRSIEADDIGGVQAIYGAASSTKPVITSAVNLGTTITVSGRHFAATGNEVWFAPSSVTLDTLAAPLVVVTGQNSVGNGSVISVVIPAGAGPGDIVVKVPGTGFDVVSNTWPMDVTVVPACIPPVSACGMNPNSYDPSGASMGYSGSISVAQNDLTLLCQGIPPLKSTLFYYGRSANTVVPFGNGTRCIDAPIFRMPPATTADATGHALHVVDLNNLPAAGVMLPGCTMSASAFFRDPAAGGAQFNTADVLSWTWCP